MLQEKYSNEKDQNLRVSLFINLKIKRIIETKIQNLEGLLKGNQYMFITNFLLIRPW